MASVFKRKQSGCKPALYAKVDLGERTLDGKIVWRMRRVPDEHQSSLPSARRWADDHERDEQAKRERGVVEAKREPTCGELMDKWEKALTNRSADDDRSRLKLHLLPTFGPMKPSEVKVSTLMSWIDKQRATKKSDGEGGEVQKWSDATTRHALNLLSRFFGWAVEREHAAFNPVRLIRQGSRPQQTPKRDIPWLDDDAAVRKLVRQLTPPVGYMFYLGNRSGLRLGEIVGLRISDLGFLATGSIRARYTYDGAPLKEDKRGEGKAKWAPAPNDAVDLFAPLLAQREAEGAGPEDFLFANPRREGKSYRKEYIEDCWDEAAVAVGLSRLEGEGTEGEHKVPSLTFYQATRHSFVSRNLAGGASLEAVSEAVGHSSPVVTQRYYNHFVRKEYPSAMRAGLGLGADSVAAVEGAELVSLKPAKKSSGRGASVKPARKSSNHGAGDGAEEDIAVGPKMKNPETGLVSGS